MLPAGRFGAASFRATRLSDDPKQRRSVTLRGGTGLRKFWSVAFGTLYSPRHDRDFTDDDLPNVRGRVC